MTNKRWEKEYKLLAFIGSEYGNFKGYIKGEKGTKEIITGTIGMIAQTFLNLPEAIDIDYDYRKGAKIRVKVRKGAILIERIK